MQPFLSSAAIEEDILNILGEIGDEFDCDGDEFEARSDSPSTTSADQVVRRRRIRPKRKKNYIPRVVKSDIRRHYGSMVANVLNSCNNELMHSFFQNYAIPAFRMEMRQVDPSSYAHLPPQVIQNNVSKFVKGISFDGEEWLKFMSPVCHAASPDQVFRLNNVRLVTRLNDESSLVVMDTEIEGSRVYDINPLDVLDYIFSYDSDEVTPGKHSQHQAVLRTSALNASAPTSTPVSTYSSPSSRLQHDGLNRNCNAKQVFGPSVKLLPQPKRVRMQSQMVLVLGVDRRIESIIVGDGRLPVDVLEALESQASALSSPALRSG